MKIIMGLARRLATTTNASVTIEEVTDPALTSTFRSFDIKVEGDDIPSMIFLLDRVSLEIDLMKNKLREER